VFLFAAAAAVAVTWQLLRSNSPNRTLMILNSQWKQFLQVRRSSAQSCADEEMMCWRDGAGPGAGRAVGVPRGRPGRPWRQWLLLLLGQRLAALPARSGSP